MRDSNGSIRADVGWDDVRIVYDRMKGRQLLEVQARPGSIAGHIMSIAVFARAERREGGYINAGDAIDWYAQFKKVDGTALREQIESYWRDTGHWGASAEAIIEGLSRV